MQFAAHSVAVEANRRGYSLTFVCAVVARAVCNVCRLCAQRRAAPRRAVGCEALAWDGGIRCARQAGCAAAIAIRTVGTTSWPRLVHRCKPVDQDKYHCFRGALRRLPWNTALRRIGRCCWKTVCPHARRRRLHNSCAVLLGTLAVTERTAVLPGISRLCTSSPLRSDSDLVGGGKVGGEGPRHQGEETGGWTGPHVGYTCSIPRERMHGGISRAVMLQYISDTVKLSRT